MTPTVSIIVPAYNVAGFIAETLASVQAQTRDDWEVLIIDDGSPDDLASAVQPFLADSRFTLHRFDNGGLATARNRGIALARGAFVALLDGDDLFDPDYLEAMLAAFDADPALDFVTCDALLFGVPEREGRRYSEFEPQLPPITLERVLQRRFNVFGLCMVRTATMRSHGGYAAELKASEDLDLWIRLLAAGSRAGYVARPLCRYRRRAGSLSNSPELLIRSDIAVYFRAQALLPAAHPAAAIARAQLVDRIADLELWLGKVALRNGDDAAARLYLRAATRARRLPKWRALLWLLQLSPAAARRVMDWRRRRATGLQQLSQATAPNG